MAIFKGQVPFEIPNDEDDSKFTDEENLGLKKIQYCFTSDTPTMEEVEAEIKRVKNNLKKMSDEEIYDNLPENVIAIIRYGLRSTSDLHPNKDGTDSIKDKKTIGAQIRLFINSRTPEEVYKDLNNSDGEKLKNMSELKESLKNELTNAICPFKQEDLDHLCFYDALVTDLFGPVSNCESLNSFPQHFYGEDRLGSNIKNIPGRPTLDVSLYDISDDGDLWLYFYFNNKVLYENDLKLFLSDYCKGYNLLETWHANIDDDGIIEFPMSEVHLLEETNTDPISELSNYVNIHYTICKNTFDDIDSILDMIQEVRGDDIDDSDEDEEDDEISQDSLDYSDLDIDDHYTSFPSDSELYLRDPEAFSCTGYIPTENILEKFIEKFGETLSIDDMIKNDIFFKGIQVNFSNFSEFKLIPQYTMENRCVIGYLVSKQPTATGCYVAFYINEEGNFAAIIPPFGNAVDPKTGKPYDIRTNREYFTPDGVLKNFDIRAIQTQLEMVLYPIKKVRSNLFKYGTLLLTVDTEPDDNRVLIGRLRFNNQNITKEFKEKYDITTEYINIYYKPEKKITNKKAFTYLSDFFFSLGKTFVESKLLENTRLKRVDGKWFIDLKLNTTMEYLNDIFSS